MCKIHTNTTDYQPIDCNLYDVYIQYSMHKNVVNIMDISNGKIMDSGLIKDLYTKEKIEYLLLDNSNIYRLDKIQVEKKN